MNVHSNEHPSILSFIAIFLIVINFFVSWSSISGKYFYGYLQLQTLYTTFAGPLQLVLS